MSLESRAAEWQWQVEQDQRRDDWMRRWGVKPVLNRKWPCLCAPAGRAHRDRRGRWQASHACWWATGGSWVDHPSLVRRPDGEIWFISQPYGLLGDRRARLERDCAKFGLTYEVTDDSWWFPGTVMIIVRRSPVTN